MTGEAESDGKVLGPNARVAAALNEAAAILETQGANPFRVSAYRHAATTLEQLPRNIATMFALHGPEALTELPGIGTGIASAIAEMLLTGRWAQLERLRGDIDPVAVFRAVPGIGAELAERIHATLHIDTLESLESALESGELRAVEGIGPRLEEAIGAGLAPLLDRRRVRRTEQPAAADLPSAAMLLDVDREYRGKARLGHLKTIAPKRNNPSGEAWLPLLQTTRGAWHFTALYSNTAQAHHLGRTRDWVVIYFYDDQHLERQCTVVTETHGPMLARRVLRGRETECRLHYQATDPFFGRQPGPEQA